MKSKIIICILVLIFFISAVSSTNLQDIGFNVSSELKQHDGDGLQFEDGTGDSFIIVEKQLTKELKENIEKCIIEFKKEFLKDA